MKGMSHEPKSPSLGMLSTATRTTATVNPLTPSPLNGALVPSGSPATSSALSAQAAPSSSFAAALRKLAKQAEEPRGKRRARRAAPRSGGESSPFLPAQASRLLRSGRSSRSHEPPPRTFPGLRGRGRSRPPRPQEPRRCREAPLFGATAHHAAGEQRYGELRAGEAPGTGVLGWL
ncbi:genetic suppressor element 1-like [Physeter macrocephalus]|uniref:Genetic suppressor element 1-like n=1 Tax=Physeter macrocephalus TaxID=9755 RepID=A0A455AV99_PHYMC|nr:genetic suppressor element 1-like [Physeter catodon]|eukprot:XP_028340099.1 genetic suppressor element 1-like [Physeter catodon]